MNRFDLDVKTGPYKKISFATFSEGMVQSIRTSDGKLRLIRSTCLNMGPSTQILFRVPLETANIASGLYGSQPLGHCKLRCEARRDAQF